MTGFYEGWVFHLGLKLKGVVLSDLEGKWEKMEMKANERGKRKRKND